MLLKVVAALFDNLKFVLSPSYAPSRKFKEAAQIAAHAPPTPALCGSELPRHWKEGCVVFDRLCRLERVTRHHLRDGRHAHGQRRGVQAAQDSRCHCREARHEFLVLISRSELLNRRVELLERTRTTFILPAHFSVFVKPLVLLGSWSSMATPTHTFLRRSLSQELAQELRSIVRRLRNVAAELERAVRIAAPALSKGRFA